MSVISLLPCRWRSPGVCPGRQGCSSPIVRAGPYGVADYQCYACRDRDHRDPAAVAPAVAGDGWIRHLLYHCYPIGAAWRWHMAVLRAHMSLFQGRRIMTVATGPGTAPIAEVAAELEGWGVELVEVANHSDRKEMAGYPLLLRLLEAHRGPQDCHLYAHTKGVVTEGWADGARRWAEAMYEALLDYWPCVARELQTHCTVGIFRRNWMGPVRTRARWHYSGSFRWTRNADLYSRDWETIDQTWLGSETHPGLMFGAGESACLYGEFSTQDVGLYQSQEWARWAQPRRDEWLSAHAGDRQQPVLTTVILTAHAQPVLVHEAIESVLAQTSDAWQLVIMDSGPLAAAGAYDRYRGDARIRVLVTGETEDMRRECAMQAVAINLAWSGGHVRGDLVLHLCDDDLLDPAIVQRFTACSRLYLEQAAWYGRCERAQLDAAGRRRQCPPLPAVGILRPGTPGDCRVDGMQVCHRRGVRTAWPTAKATAWHADGLWVDALAAVTPIHPVDHVVGTHRFTPLSTFTRRI